jgi:hypothetical protein
MELAFIIIWASPSTPIFYTSLYIVDVHETVIEVKI